MVQEKSGSGRTNGASAARREEIDSFTRGFVCKAARQLAGTSGLPRQDREEIEQELYLKIAVRLSEGDANDPQWKAFVAVTVRRHVVSMIRAAKAEKRDHRRVRSLDERVNTANGPQQLSDLVGDHEIPSRRSRMYRSGQERAELRLDVTACVAGLEDDRHREFCERLQRDSISQVSRDMGVPRTTLNDWITRLRGPFEQNGLKDYL